jgi:hypothetical protein
MVNTANPNDNRATVVCKTISLEPSSFMGQPLPYNSIQLREMRPGENGTGPSWVCQRALTL